MYRGRESNEGAITDRFNQIVATCTILDIDEKINREELFHTASEHLSEQLSVSREIVFERLAEREKTSSTALTPLFAVPHIMVDGEKKFTILVVRNKPGVNFSSSAPSVHAIFFLVGTIDERTTHLRALAGIAQTVNSPTFKQHWLEASDTEALRKLIVAQKSTLENGR
jgi:mannitol/fructose-specific phosphotransferase system IIA component (Ntr-type)